MGAAIDLGNCLDLSHRENLDLLGVAYSGLKTRFDAAGRSLPEYKDPRGSTHGDKVLRHFNCAVITYLHAVTMEASEADFDTVRGLFVEGDPIYPGAAFHRHSHTQIAVRSTDCICGLFRVRERATPTKRAAGKSPSIWRLKRRAAPLRRYNHLKQLSLFLLFSGKRRPSLLSPSPHTRDARPPRVNTRTHAFD